MRRLPLLIEFRNQVYPSLALAAVAAYRRTRMFRLTVTGPGAARLHLDDLAIPLEGQSAIRLRFRGEGRTFARVSAGEVLAGRAPAAALRERVVLVGAGALAIRDTTVTPTARMLPGVDVQATAVDNLLQGDLFHRPPGARFWEMVVAFAAALLSAFVFAAFRPLWAPILLVALGAAGWLGSATLLSESRVFLSPLPVTLLLGANLLVFPLVNLFDEKRKADYANRRLAAASSFAVKALTELTGLRDFETGEHLLRVQHYTRILCDSLASHPRFRSYLQPATIELLVQLVPLHDIGKVGVPDRVLRKPGPLTPDEVEIVKRHTAYGRDVLENARRESGIEDETLLQLAREVIYCHHERWDGTGYPEGLRGEAIPLPGRLLALVDVYDALTAKRIYRDALPHDQVASLIREGRGTQFDPEMVDAFLANQERWVRIAREYADVPAAPGSEDGAEKGAFPRAK